MIDTLQRFFRDTLGAESNDDGDEPSLALATAALLCEVARADYRLDKAELRVLRDELRRQFALDEPALDELMALAQEETEAAVDHHRFVRLLRDHCGYETRRELVRVMWALALADGVKDPLEEYRIRRLAELLHVSHADFIRAKLVEEARANQARGEQAGDEEKEA